MFSQYFGNYLLNKGILTTEQLHDALNLSNSTRIRLGVLAINAGLLNADQVEEIQNLQRTLDKRFGEIAVMKGYLTEDQVQQLLKTQTEDYMLLGQALTDRKYLTIQQLEDAMNSYKKESGLTDEQFQAFQQGNIDKIVRVLLDFPELPKKDLFYDYAALILRNILRFLGEEARLGACIPARGFTCPILAAQDIEGETNFYTALAMDENVYLDVAVKYSGMQLTTSELADASLSEFLNLVNGLFIVNMSNRGVELKIQPPRITRDAKIAAAQANVIPYYLNKGPLYVIISLEQLL